MDRACPILIDAIRRAKQLVSGTVQIVFSQESNSEIIRYNRKIIYKMDYSSPAESDDRDSVSEEEVSDECNLAESNIGLDQFNMHCMNAEQFDVSTSDVVENLCRQLRCEYLTPMGTAQKNAEMFILGCQILFEHYKKGEPQRRSLIRNLLAESDSLSDFTLPQLENICRRAVKWTTFVLQKGLNQILVIPSQRSFLGDCSDMEYYRRLEITQPLPSENWHLPIYRSAIIIKVADLYRTLREITPF
jgi:hypothetical protein